MQLSRLECNCPDLNVIVQFLRKVHVNTRTLLKKLWNIQNCCMKEDTGHKRVPLIGIDQSDVTTAGIDLQLTFLSDMATVT
jgi:hypothetical protein